MADVAVSDVRNGGTMSEHAASRHEGYCSGDGCASCEHRATGVLRGCDDPKCGYLPACAGNRDWMRATAERKLRAIEDGTIHSCCMPQTEDEVARLYVAAGRPARSTL